MDDLGRRLRRIRESRNLSIYEVERRTGMHFSTISKYERNERQPSLEVLRELAAVYQVPVTALIADETDLHAVLPPRIAVLARHLLERPELVEACERLVALDRAQVTALVELLDRLGVVPRRQEPSAPEEPGDPRDHGPAGVSGGTAGAPPGPVRSTGAGKAGTGKAGTGKAGTGKAGARGVPRDAERLGRGPRR